MPAGPHRDAVELAGVPGDLEVLVKLGSQGLCGTLGRPLKGHGERSAQVSVIAAPRPAPHRSSTLPGGASSRPCQSTPSSWPTSAAVGRSTCSLFPSLPTSKKCSASRSARLHPGGEGRGHRRVDGGVEPRAWVPRGWNEGRGGDSRPEAPEPLPCTFTWLRWAWCQRCPTWS